AIVPEHAEAAGGDLHGVLLSAAEAASDDLPKNGDKALWALARLEPPGGATPALARRIAALRCTAAQKLARAAWDSAVVRGCDVADGEAGEAARLAALDRAEIGKSRRAAWLELARSKHLRVREAAVDAIARHAELGDAARAVLAESLAAPQAGLVATA